MDLTHNQSIDETLRLTHIRLGVMHRAITTLQAQVAASRRLVDESREALWRARGHVILNCGSSGNGGGERASA